MKHYVFTRTEGRGRRDGTGGTPYTVRIWRIVKGRAVKVTEHTETFVSPFQQVLNAMEAFADGVSGNQRQHCLPKAAFKKNPFGGWEYGLPMSLREAGIASFDEVY